jgi:hypothetical protein
VPSNLVEQQHGMGPRRHRGGDLDVVQVIASVLQRGRTRATPLPSPGQAAPKI